MDSEPSDNSKDDDIDWNSDFDDEDDALETMSEPYDLLCPAYGVEYDEIDVDFQICHLCGHDNS